MMELWFAPGPGEQLSHRLGRVNWHRLWGTIDEDISIISIQFHPACEYVRLGSRQHALLMGVFRASSCRSCRFAAELRP